MQRVWWSRVDGDVLRYDLQKTDEDGRWWLVAQITPDIPGDNWDTGREQFFFDDTNGETENFYRVTAISVNGTTLAESDVFQVISSPTNQISSRVRVDHDFPTADAMRYLSPGSIPIPQASVLVFTEPDWNQGRRNNAVARTQTTADGRWAAPVYLPTGLNYVVYFVKESAYGPDTTTITV